MWEQWEGVDPAGVPHESLNHYSKGAVASFLHHYVAGLRPTAPGYRTFEVRPRPGGGISWASTRHTSAFGHIEVAWRLAGGSMELDVLVPPGSSATVVRPEGGVLALTYLRLVGWASAEAAAGQPAEITVSCDRRMWRRWDTSRGCWQNIPEAGELLIARGLGDIRIRLSVPSAPHGR